LHDPAPLGRRISQPHLNLILLLHEPRSLDEPFAIMHRQKVDLA
jgi:hypothetical protein